MIMSLTDEDQHWFAAQLLVLGTKFEARFEALDAKIERVETTLVTEFHKWASPAEARARTHSAALRAVDLELDLIA
jgi:hypothetical protein